MALILVTNDDGYRSDGIAALAEALGPLGEVAVVAPVDEASAIGHALTLRYPLRLEHVRKDVFGVNGTPADCVNIAISQVFKRLPDLVVSGINKGLNLGDDVTYSGTVAGAMEGALLGVPGLAVSLEAGEGVYHFAQAARIAAALSRLVLERGLPARTFLNINVPKGASRGLRVTVQAKRNHVTSVLARHDPKGRPYFWIEEGQNEWQADERSDYQALRDGYVSVTPLHPDLTAYGVLGVLEEAVRQSAGDEGRHDDLLAARQDR